MTLSAERVRAIFSKPTPVEGLTTGMVKLLTKKMQGKPVRRRVFVNPRKFKPLPKTVPVVCDECGRIFQADRLASRKEARKGMERYCQICNHNTK